MGQEVIYISSDDSSDDNLYPSSEALQPAKEPIDNDNNSGSLQSNTASASPVLPDELIRVDLNSILVTMHSFDRPAPVFWGVRGRNYYVGMTNDTDYSYHPRDLEELSLDDTDEETVITVYLPEGMGPIYVNTHDVLCRVDCFPVQDYLHVGLPRSVRFVRGLDNTRWWHIDKDNSYLGSPERGVYDYDDMDINGDSIN